MHSLFPAVFLQFCTWNKAESLYIRPTLNCIQLRSLNACFVHTVNFYGFSFSKLGRLGWNGKAAFPHQPSSFAYWKGFILTAALDFPPLDTLHLSMALLLISCCCIVFLHVFLHSIHRCYCGTMFDLSVSCRCEWMWTG